MSKLTASKILEEMKLGNLSISPFNKNQLNPNSYNIKLSNILKKYNTSGKHVLDVYSNNDYEEKIIPGTGLILRPGILYIGSTEEIVSSDKYVTGIDGRSSIGRLGISIHATAGFGDIGFKGSYTLEIFVIQPVRIYPGIEIGQIYFEDVVGDVDFLYNGRYQGQIKPETSKMYIKNKDLNNKYFYKG